MPKGNRYDAEHLRNVSSYQRQIDEIFKRAAEEAARIAEASGAEHDPDKVFSFDDYPSVRKRVDKMTSDLSSRVERTIVNGIKAQWELSNRKNDDLVETVTGLKADDFPSDQRKRYFGTNESARKAFLDRREKGLSLSDRVWKQSERFRKDMELGIDVSLGEGMSADELGRQLRGYLNHPETLFRRVRDERGNLVLSKNAAVFHPGRGVYRSSYMNARRLAATETNMAYRSADHERWKNLDFVVGIEIQTSNNHTTKDSKGKPQPLEDICDTLAGRYPKDFKFVGWHPHCRCIATTILKTEEEMQADTERILNGEEPLPASASKNYEENLPDKFTKWLEKNADRIENAKSLPYFLKDNQGLINASGGVAMLSGTPATTTTTTTTTTPTPTPTPTSTATPPTTSAGTAQTATNPAPTTQQGNTDILKLSDSVPDWTFKGENTRDTLWARVKYFDESLERCYGKNLELLNGGYDNVTREEWMNRIREIVKKSIANVSKGDYGYAKSVFGYMQGTGKCVANSINHLQELRKITTKDIPEIWRTAYNDAIKELNAYDFSNGYFGVYAKIEKAYNIYKLAGLDDVKKLKYENVSVNTPYNLFTEFKNKIPDVGQKLPPKGFFDMLKDFVPLADGGGSSTGYYDLTYNTVFIPINNRYRIVLKQILIHEYGHAYDQQIGMRGKQDVKTTFNNWADTMTDKAGDAGKELKDKINRELILNAQKNETLETDEKIRRNTIFREDLGVLSDMLGAARGEELSPVYHPVSYFSSEDNRLAEFASHCWETYWMDLDNFKRLQPKLYEEMRKLAENYK